MLNQQDLVHRMLSIMRKWNYVLLQARATHQIDTNDLDVSMAPLSLFRKDIEWMLGAIEDMSGESKGCMSFLLLRQFQTA